MEIISPLTITHFSSVHVWTRTHVKCVNLDQIWRNRQIFKPISDVITRNWAVNNKLEWIHCAERLVYLTRYANCYNQQKTEKCSRMPQTCTFDVMAWSGTLNKRKILRNWRKIKRTQAECSNCMCNWNAWHGILKDLAPNDVTRAPQQDVTQSSPAVSARSTPE